MRFGGLLSVVLMLVGALAVVAGAGLIAAANMERAVIEAALAEAAGAVDRVEGGLGGAARGYAEAELMLPQVVGALDQAATITGVSGAVLGETGEAAAAMVTSLRLLARDLRTLADRVRLLTRPGELRETSAQVEQSAEELAGAVTRLAELRAAVDALAPQMTAIATQVRAVEARLAPTRQALPDLRERVAAARARFDPAAVTRYVVWAADGVGAVVILLGVVLWGVGSTRRQLARAAG